MYVYKGMLAYVCSVHACEYIWVCLFVYIVCMYVLNVFAFAYSVHV